MMKAGRQKLEPEAQDLWLSEYLPHHLRCGLAGLPLLDQLVPAQMPEVRRAGVRRASVEESLWEQRLTTVRWLIEFVGIMAKRGDPVRAPRNRATDFSIVQFEGGLEVQLDTPEAKLLAQVWTACGKVGANPAETGHLPDLEPAMVEQALQVIWTHLGRTIYSRVGRRIEQVTFPRAGDLHPSAPIPPEAE